MTGSIIENVLDALGLELSDHAICRDGKPVGILVPGILCGLTGGELRVLGPRGIATGPNCDPVDGLAVIAAAGGVLTGDPDEIDYVADGLRNPRTSRNFSYYCCLFPSCGLLREGVGRLVRSHVTVVGCGGIGSLVAMNVVAAGVGRLRLVDGDHVEASNLNRQFIYALEDIGARKTEVLSREIMRRFPEVEIEVINKPAVVENLAGICAGTDLVMMTGDEPVGALDYTTRHAREASVPVVVAGYNAATGLVTSAWAPGSLDRGMSWHRAPQAVMPSFGPTNVELAGVAARLAIQLLAGKVPVDAAVTHALGGHHFRVTLTAEMTLG